MIYFFHFFSEEGQILHEASSLQSLAQIRGAIYAYMSGVSSQLSVDWQHGHLK